MENISQKQTTPRGRPRLVSQEYEKRLAEVWTPGGQNWSRHGRTNLVYMQRAGQQFSNDARFAWLLCDQAPDGNPNGVLRRTIVTELGRIEDEEEREALALDLCERKPTTREAVAQIRAYRLGRHPRGTARQLALAWQRTMLEYLAGHPDMESEALRSALASLEALVDRIAGEGS